MRVIALMALLIAFPAVAQPFPGMAQYDDLRMQQDLERMRAIDQANRLMALEAQVRTEQALRQVEAQRLRPVLPPPADPAARAPTLEVRRLIGIPDDRLAASNARVRAASEPAR